MLETVKSWYLYVFITCLPSESHYIVKKFTFFLLYLPIIVLKDQVYVFPAETTQKKKHPNLMKRWMDGISLGVEGWTWKQIEGCILYIEK